MKMETGHGIQKRLPMTIRVCFYNLHTILTSVEKKKRTVNFTMIMKSSLAPVKTRTTAGFPSLFVMTVKCQMTQAMRYCGWQHHTLIPYSRQ